MEYETLTIQAIITFLSSMGGMTVYLWLWCPNHRCCRFSDVRSRLENDTRCFLPPQQKEKSEDLENG